MSAVFYFPWWQTLVTGQLNFPRGRFMLLLQFYVSPRQQQAHFIYH